MKAGKGSRWPGKRIDNGEIGPYNLPRFKKEAKRVGYGFIVEGESDTWTGNFHEIPTLGIPGASFFSMTRLKG